ncbi:MAG: type I methionyl aminopeptidase [Gammaproteobacteria bacterium]|nr:type I methionyl aminopeptidase [Gammaproteobacteria bacterium]
MSVEIKSAKQIKKMQLAGKLAADVLDMIEPHVKVGVTTDELDKICHDYIVDVQQAIPAPLNYHGFPKSICTSVNHQVCHGIPNNKKLKSGDIINIDITVIKDGYHGDTSRMFKVGKATVKGDRICKISYDCLQIGIDVVKPGVDFSAIGQAIEVYANKQYCSVVREYCGHGIGQKFHAEPQVVHYADKNSGIIMEPGMTFTIEPMINLGKREIKQLPDKWTVITKDRSLSAQWEHTILVTDTGCEILTLSEN